MSDIPSFPYAIPRGERTLRSIANLTRRDGVEFLALAPRVPVHTRVEPFPLTAANTALVLSQPGLFDYRRACDCGRMARYADCGRVGTRDCGKSKKAA